MAEEKGSGEAEIKDASTASITAIGQKKKHPGIVSRIWNVIFNVDGNNLEKRLQYISKEESASLARMKRRSQTWRQMARNLIMFSVALEVIAVGYAIITTRVEHLEWKTRAFRVLPMFLLPVLASLAYSAFASFRKHCDRKDQSTLEHLRAERQEKIDELKEKTNYYSTQQLIQKYDTDPAAKAAAATVLASKLGADSGLKVLVRDESTNPDFSAGKSSDVELSQSNQLRRRRQPPPSESNSADSIRFQQYDEDNNIRYSEEGPLASSDPSQLVVGHYNPPAPSINDGGWIARIAALLVGEDPTQSYALICENCHMHNGLARKEDFEYITYYCPHCQALNRPKQSEEQVSGANTPSKDLDSTNNAGTYVNDSDLRQDHPVEAMSKMKEEEVTEKAEPVKLSF